HKTQSDVAQLTRERDQALEREKATAKVLQVISRSPGELGPVFKAMLENAVELCQARFGNLLLFEGGEFRVVAMHGAPRAYQAFRRRNPAVPTGAVLNRLVEAKRVIQVADLAETLYADAAIVKLARARTLVSVPMLKEDKLIGAILIYRQEVRPF